MSYLLPEENDEAEIDDVCDVCHWERCRCAFNPDDDGMYPDTGKVGDP